jgi:hypothetical protein
MRPLRGLLSYHYHRKRGIEPIHTRWSAMAPISLFGDSGAFSAANSGVPVKVEEYSDWLKDNGKFFDAYANLDVIRDPEASARNLKYLMKRGHHPLPVFHTGSDLKYLERIIKDGHAYICLGGMVGVNKKTLMPWVVKCFQLAERLNPEVRFHGFGLTSFELVKAFPWRSVDSTTWLNGGKYALLQLFDPRTGTFKLAKLFNKRQIIEAEGLIRLNGGDPNDFMERGRGDYRHAYLVCVNAWRHLERWMEMRHSDRSFKLYLAGLSNQVVQMFSEAQHGKSNGRSVGRAGQHDNSVLGEGTLR